eukprot:SAG31_NODE_1179_length_9530_cov_8.153748_15_plen_37_part_00
MMSQIDKKKHPEITYLDDQSGRERNKAELIFKIYIE